MDFTNKTRDYFHEIINEKGYKTGLEIGVGHGYNAEYLLKNSNLTLLYGIDNWMGNKTGKNRNNTLEKLSAYGDRYNFILGDSAEAASQCEDGSLDYVYVDGDHSYAPPFPYICL